MSNTEKVMHTSCCQILANAQPQAATVSHPCLINGAPQTNFTAPSNPGRQVLFAPNGSYAACLPMVQSLIKKDSLCFTEPENLIFGDSTGHSTCSIGGVYQPLLPQNSSSKPSPLSEVQHTVPRKIRGDLSAIPKLSDDLHANATFIAFSGYTYIVDFLKQFSQYYPTCVIDDYPSVRELEVCKLCLHVDGYNSCWHQTCARVLCDTSYADLTKHFKPSKYLPVSGSCVPVGCYIL